jgi:hypothetical protein
MSQVHWLNAVSGSFTNAADWSGGAVPGPSDDAILDAPGSTPYTVTITSVQMINSLQTAANATLDLASGYVGDAEGTGAGVNAGIILVGAGATFVAGGEIVSSGRIEVYGAGATFSATGEVANSGTIAIAGAASGGALFLVNNAATFSGGGDIVLGYSTDELGAASAALYNIDNTITGRGAVEGALTNGAAGVIDCATAGSTLKLSGGKVVNMGVIEATGSGALILTSAIVNNGVLRATGAGTLEFENTGLVQNGASQVVSATNKSTVMLGSGSELSLGTLKAAGSGKVVVSGGTIDRMTLLGTIEVESGTLADDVVNKGTIDLDDGGLNAYRATLSGGGVVDMQGDITGNFQASYVTNLDNTIIGSGLITGNVVNEVEFLFTNGAHGLIDADGTSAGLTIGENTADTVVNDGTIECTAAGGLTFGGSLQNSGVIVVAAGTASVLGTLTGPGSLDVDDATLVIKKATSAFVTFTGKSGELVLDASQSFGGAIIGFSKTGGTTLDVNDIPFAGGTEALYAGGNAGGVLTVTDQVKTAHIQLQGDYLGETFRVASDGNGGTLVVAHKTASAPAAPDAFVSAMASMAAAPGEPLRAASPDVDHFMPLGCPRTMER